LGRAGRWLNRGSQRAASTRWLAETAAFHLGRRIANRTIGGETYFSTTETLERTELLLRRVLEHEGVIPIVRGPRTAYGADGGTKGLARAERRRRAVDDGLAAICARLHVEYHSKEGKTPGQVADTLLGDGIHVNIDGSEELGIEQGQHMVDAWRRAQATG
jgi:hypothetical protein